MWSIFEAVIERNLRYAIERKFTDIQEWILMQDKCLNVNLLLVDAD